MRIAMVAPPWVPVPPPAYGGTEAVVDQLCRGLASAGHEVTLFATGDSRCPVPIEWVYETARTDDMGNAAIELRHLLHAYDRIDGFDVAHDHTLVGPVRAAALATMPVVTTNHGPFDEELTDIYRATGDRVQVIAISQRQAARARDIPIARVIHHGVDPSRFPVGSGQGGYLVFLGRMAPSKGVDLAARAAREAGATLVIAAKMREQAEREYFEARVRPLLGSTVEFIGEVGFDEKVDLLANARALLNPIQWEEPFGMVMVEALACGTPVVTSPMGAAPEIIDHGVTGFLCGRAGDLAEGIDSVGALDRSACRAVVLERFTTDRMVADHLEVYAEAVRRHGRRLEVGSVA
jgi:glycosyltransferase involved in cell wall biosynthesis